MKQLTIDWDTYQKELREAHAGGVNLGIKQVADFLESGKTYQEFFGKEPAKEWQKILKHTKQGQ